MRDAMTEPDPDILEACLSLYNAAKAGTVVTLAVVARVRDADGQKILITNYVTTAAQDIVGTYGVVGALDCLKTSIVDEINVANAWSEDGAEKAEPEP